MANETPRHKIPGTDRECGYQALENVVCTKCGWTAGHAFDPSEVNILNREWASIIEQVKGGDERALRRARRWVLIHSFGDLAKFNLDAEFHARVSQAEQMLAHMEGLR